MRSRAVPRRKFGSFGITRISKAFRGPSKPVCESVSDVPFSRLSMGRERQYLPDCVGPGGSHVDAWS